MKLNGTLFILFGIALIIGGLIGFAKAGSIPSLIAGGASGVSILLLGTYTLKQSVLSENIALLLTLLLDIFFSFRLLKAKTFIPSGVMTLITSLVIVVVCLNIRKRMSKTIN